MSAGTKVAHTPTPWHRDDDAHDFYPTYAHLYGPIGTGSLVMPGDPEAAEDSALVCIVQREEDVPLIQHAGELLEALERILASDGSGGVYDAFALSDAYDMARAAIKKARGQS